MPETSRDAYLAELDALLPFPPERRAEILEEIESHLDDAAADGLSESRAQSRLGAPIGLARELARPEQTPLRLLAAAGAGVRAAIGPWLYGYLLASLLVFVGLLAISAVARVASELVARDLALALNGGWNTVVTAIAIGVALAFAGRAAAEAASNAGRRLRSDVQPWVAGIGTTLAAVVLLLLIEFPQNAASAVALAAAPGGVAVGVYRPEVVGSLRRVGATTLLLILLAVTALSLIGLYASAPSVSIGDETPAATLDSPSAIAGPTWRTPDGLPLVESSGWSNDEGVVSVEWQPRRWAALAQFSDLRVEAWHAEEGAEWGFDRGHDAPFAIGAVERRHGGLAGTVVTNRDPDVDVWQLVLTGRAPDGVRYVLDASGGGQSAFTGSVWDWAMAVTD